MDGVAPFRPEARARPSEQKHRADAEQRLQHEVAASGEAIHALFEVAHRALALLVARKVLLPPAANTQSDTPRTLSVNAAYSSFLICLQRACRAALARTDTSGTRKTATPSTRSIASARRSESQPRHATSAT